jgi:hypothetical protein
MAGCLKISRKYKCPLFFIPNMIPPLVDDDVKYGTLRTSDFIFVRYGKFQNWRWNVPYYEAHCIKLILMDDHLQHRKSISFLVSIYISKPRDWVTDTVNRVRSGNRHILSWVGVSTFVHPERTSMNFWLSSDGARMPPFYTVTQINEQRVQVK